MLAQSDLSADALLDRYCAAQHAHHGTITHVAEKLNMNRRTVRNRIAAWQARNAATRGRSTTAA